MENEKLKYLTAYLLSEHSEWNDLVFPTNESEQFHLYRSLVNIRPAGKASAEYLKAEDEFLRGLTAQKGITSVADLQPVEVHIYLWKGDITTLQCGAIVNAANSGMTGCYHPCHNCIDNCIHTFAGVRLRLKCAEIMKAQGHEEPTGTAKITPAYNLPCDYVIHTGVKSIAFCCISTGVFGFPQEKAAEIAVDTIRTFLKTHEIEVICNVFSEKDFRIYQRLLG